MLDWYLPIIDIGVSSPIPDVKLGFMDLYDVKMKMKMQVDHEDDLGKVNLLQSHIKTLPPVLADEGSTHNVFNHVHRMLFISYRSIQPTLTSGVGGETVKPP